MEASTQFTAPNLVSNPIYHVDKIMQQHGGSQESDGDILALLPKHTVVNIIGNNRTRASLIGQHAVVKRSVGLGGWHWLTLQSGEEVKLQRNALQVVEFPTGNEEPSSSEEEQQRLHHAGYPAHLIPTPLGGVSRPSPFTPQASLYSSRPQAPSKRPRTAEDTDGRRTTLRQTSTMRVNLGKLNTASLRRYGALYHLAEAAPSFTRAQLLEAVSAHFAAQLVEEEEVLHQFIEATQRHSMGGAAGPRS